MNKRIGAILEDLAVTLNGLNGVFSTSQWGGRAYKMPGPNGNMDKPKLLAFLLVNKDQASINVAFKLSKLRSVEVVQSYDWIAPHSVSTLAPAGWVVTTIANKRQTAILKKLLAESRDLYPAVEVEVKAPPKRRGRRSAHLEKLNEQMGRIIGELASRGLRPMDNDDDGFDD